LAVGDFRLEFRLILCYIVKMQDKLSDLRDNLDQISQIIAKTVPYEK